MSPLRADLRSESERRSPDGWATSCRYQLGDRSADRRPLASSAFCGGVGFICENGHTEHSGASGLTLLRARKKPGRQSEHFLASAEKAWESSGDFPVELRKSYVFANFNATPYSLFQAPTGSYGLPWNRREPTNSAPSGTSFLSPDALTEGHKMSKCSNCGAESRVRWIVGLVVHTTTRILVAVMLMVLGG